MRRRGNKGGGDDSSSDSASPSVRPGGDQRLTYIPPIHVRRGRWVGLCHTRDTSSLFDLFLSPQVAGEGGRGGATGARRRGHGKRKVVPGAGALPDGPAYRSPARVGMSEADMVLAELQVRAEGHYSTQTLRCACSPECNTRSCCLRVTTRLCEATVIIDTWRGRRDSSFASGGTRAPRSDSMSCTCACRSLGGPTTPRGPCPSPLTSPGARPVSMRPTAAAANMARRPRHHHRAAPTPARSRSCPLALFSRRVARRLRGSAARSWTRAARRRGSRTT
jgi:hypothetical protein